jgi:hypothetical protein
MLSIPKYVSEIRTFNITNADFLILQMYMKFLKQVRQALKKIFSRITVLRQIKIDHYRQVHFLEKK